MKTDKLDRIFSLFIRIRDSDDKGYGHCITCGKLINYKEGHCGHFISRRHQSTRFDERNCALQCVSCNTFNQGKQYEYGLAIDKKYGKGTAENLLVKSRMTVKLGKFEIDYMTQYYKQKVKELKQTKGL